MDGLLSDNRPILFPLHFPIATLSPPLASVLLFLCKPTFQYLFDLFFKTFQQIYRPQNPTFQIFRWQPPSFLSPTHRQTPASNLRLPGSFVFSSAPHSSRFSRCGHSTQTDAPHPSATRGCCGLHQFFIMCAARRKFRSTRIFLASKSPCADKARNFCSSSSVSGLGKLPE